MSPQTEGGKPRNKKRRKMIECVPEKERKQEKEKERSKLL